MKKSRIFKANAIFWGVLFVVLGTLFVLLQIDVIQGNAFTVIATAFLAGIVIRSLIGFHFVPLLWGTAFLLYIYRSYIGLTEKLTIWMLLIVATVIGIGLELIFGGLKKHIKAKNRAKYEQVEDVKFRETNNFASDNTAFVSGSDIKIENSLGTTTRYIRSEEFTNGHFENGMGALTIYFDNVRLINNTATITIDNGMGVTNVYMPSYWRLNLNQDNGMGQVNIKGNPSTDINAPLVNIFVDNGMGQVNLFFN